jgi:hypothetical protein
MLAAVEASGQPGAQRGAEEHGQQGQDAVQDATGSEGEDAVGAAQVDPVHQRSGDPDPSELEHRHERCGGDEHRPPGTGHQASGGAHDQADADRGQRLSRGDRPSRGQPAGDQAVQADREHGGRPAMSAAAPYQVEG